MLQIGSIMKRDVVSLSPMESASEAVRLMAERELGAVLVTREGKLLGIFSERDLLKRVIVRGFLPEETVIESVMTPNPVAVFETTTLKDATRLVREHGFRHLPVIDNKGQVVGILSARDFLQFVVSGLESFIEEAWADRHVEEMTDPYDGFISEFSD